MNKLKSLIIKECDNIYGESSVIIYELKKEKGIFINSDLSFPAASLIKLPILFALFHKEKDLTKRYTVTKKYHAEGFGVLKNLDSGLNLTLKDLAVLMITMSDNIATNVLIDILGMDGINQEIKKLSCQHTYLNRYMMDEMAKRKGVDNYTSASDIMKILIAIKSSNMSKKMLDILFRQQYNNKLPALIDNPVCFAHKTGDLPGVEHDAGILFMYGREILLIVLTKNLHHNQHGVFLSQQIGRLVYDFFSNLEKENGE